ncbi:MAG: FAD-dependent oxidoreductase [Aeromicrobium sp.]
MQLPSSQPTSGSTSESYLHTSFSYVTFGARSPTKAAAMTVESFEVCIVGAGITGLNALAVATDYLAPGERVLLVDARPRVGGMWVDTYDYVRLHQPHGNFTAGNVRWDQGHKREHLASKAEVLDHLQHCLEVARRKVRVVERFGWNYVSHEERDGSVFVTLHSVDETQVVKAQRLVKAFGHRAAPNQPLRLSSELVQSTTPESLNSAETHASADGPVWIVGSGKTAMDTAQVLLRDHPGRDVSLVAGPGTIFSRRDTFFPSGFRRWWGGTRINSMIRDTALHFDGTNEAELRGWFRAKYGTSPFAEAGDFFGAYLSDAECESIKRGLRHLEMEYLTDVVDGPQGPALQFRSGRSRSVPEGTLVVNCTGGLLRDTHPYEPFASESGNVLSIQMRSSTTGVFSSFAGYYLTHLMFRDQLLDAGLYEMDIEDLSAQAKPLVAFASMSLAMLNLGLIADALPSKALLGCGLDYDSWYPLPRKMVGATKMMLTQRKDREHHAKTVATLATRFGIRAGLLTLETRDRFMS